MVGKNVTLKASCCGICSVELIVELEGIEAKMTRRSLATETRDHVG